LTKPAEQKRDARNDYDKQLKQKKGIRRRMNVKQRAWKKGSQIDASKGAYCPILKLLPETATEVTETIIFVTALNIALVWQNSLLRTMVTLIKDFLHPMLQDLSFPNL
jgi:hypothetical protein